MSWYYAGPEAKPVGPLTLEELQARRAGGMVTSETYVIEQPGPEGSTPAWKRYREIFPGMSVPLPPPPPPGFPSVPSPAAPHPLFPSAPHAPSIQPTYVPPVQPLSPSPYIEPHAAPHGHYPTRPTNKACAWGFGLGIASFLFCFACGAGLILGVPALIICLLGLAQVLQRPTQSGRGMAVAGAILACIAMLISVVVLIFAIPAMIKSYNQTTTQQSSE